MAYTKNNNCEKDYTHIQETAEWILLKTRTQLQ